ncbi:Cof-type HAD-IIB family hydrolase [Patescibacteria group bacterium]|nr:Cof-type HAD-IIB family hydrolase [Patescibacteria group bacterium]MBU1906593.1 Cof-type HAD-IIB family hydrolase [Patescibacteria group bacterium]
MKKPITVFLDIDGTLIDVDQTTNNPELPKLIQDFQSLGVRFGLNSNRAKEDAIEIINRFALDGPFILENGALILNTLNDSEQVDPKVPDHVPAITKEALDQVIENFFSDFSLEVTDTVKMISDQSAGQGKKFFMNQFRKYSASIHHRVNGKYSYSTAQSLAQSLNQFFKNNNHPLLALAHQHGSTVTIEIPGVDKVSGLKLYRQAHPDQIIVVIGDGKNDAALKDQANYLLAVSNASLELKQVADMVSTQPMALGVAELLEKKVRPLLTEVEK